MKIRENEIYTVSDVQRILKISQSTAMRMLKKGTIRAAKVGKQYRIMGKELLRILSPDLENELISSSEAQNNFNDQTTKGNRVEP